MCTALYIHEHRFYPVKTGMLLFLLLVWCCWQANAQVRDSTIIEADSAGIIRPSTEDSVIASQNNQPSNGSQGPLKEGEVQFQSTDSLTFDFRNDRTAHLYGSAKVKHKAGNLSSGKVKLNLDKNTVRAKTTTPGDTLSQPVLRRKGQPPVRSNKIAFNYKTNKGLFNVARVKISKGKITGTRVKNSSPRVFYLKDAKYSTCTLPHPHYYIKADEMKIIKHQHKQEVFFKNARLYILDIPYPIVFPFGYFPGNVSKHQSGLLTPSYVYQNTSTRGLGLRNLGWFQYFNDYITGRSSVDLYTSGTFYLNAASHYRKRNSYNGSVQIGYSREQGLESTDPTFNPEVEKQLHITHNQTFSPYSNLSADVNLRTDRFFKRNSYNPDERAEVTTRSHLNYHHQQPGDLYTFDASIRQSQNFQTNQVTLAGPSFNFSLNQLTPFSSDNTNSESNKWYENLSVRYNNSFESSFDFRPIRGDSAQINFLQALFHPSKYREATDDNKQYQYGFMQQANITLGDILGNSPLNLSANVNYNDFFFPTSIRKRFNPVTNEVITRRVRGFNSAREFSTNLNLSTTFYGISNLRIGHINGLRHTIRPNVSLSYSPDFRSDFFGIFRTVQNDTSGTAERFSIFEDEIFSGPTSGEQAAINFGVDNVLEARQVKRDSTGEKSTNILRLIDNLSLTSSYNFAADSLKLSNLNAQLTSSVVNGVNIRASANFNFYERDDNGRRIDRLLLFNDRQLAELTNFSLSASTSFSGGKNGLSVKGTPSFPAHYNPLYQGIYNEQDPFFNRRPIQPINSPWSFNVNFRYSWRLNPTGDDQKSATINAQNIRFQLTPKWGFSTRIGYDFIQQKLTPTRFNLNRQLHEWTLSFELNPFGDFQYYFFKLSINSSQLQSIFQKLPLLKNLERSSSPTGRGLGSF